MLQNRNGSTISESLFHFSMFKWESDSNGNWKSYNIYRYYIDRHRHRNTLYFINKSLTKWLLWKTEWHRLMGRIWNLNKNIMNEKMVYNSNYCVLFKYRLVPVPLNLMEIVPMVNFRPFSSSSTMISHVSNTFMVERNAEKCKIELTHWSTRAHIR